VSWVRSVLSSVKPGVQTLLRAIKHSGVITQGGIGRLYNKTKRDPQYNGKKSAALGGKLAKIS
jgi:hypothetical protein